MKVKETETEISFKCPGCGSVHCVPKPRWTLSGTVDAPTLTPSLVETINPKDRETHRPTVPTSVCHSKIDNGRIAFCGDSTHDMRNQTCELPDLPDYLVQQPTQETSC